MASNTCLQFQTINGTERVDVLGTDNAAFFPSDNYSILVLAKTHPSVLTAGNTVWNKENGTRFSLNNADGTLRSRVTLTASSADYRSSGSLSVDTWHWMVTTFNTVDSYSALSPRIWFGELYKPVTEDTGNTPSTATASDVRKLDTLPMRWGNNFGPASPWNGRMQLGMAWGIELTEDEILNQIEFFREGHTDRIVRPDHCANYMILGAYGGKGVQPDLTGRGHVGIPQATTSSNIVLAPGPLDFSSKRRTIRIISAFDLGDSSSSSSQSSSSSSSSKSSSSSSKSSSSSSSSQSSSSSSKSSSSKNSSSSSSISSSSKSSSSSSSSESSSSSSSSSSQSSSSSSSSKSSSSRSSSSSSQSSSSSSSSKSSSSRSSSSSSQSSSSSSSSQSSSSSSRSSSSSSSSKSSSSSSSSSSQSSSSRSSSSSSSSSSQSSSSSSKSSSSKSSSSSSSSESSSSSLSSSSISSSSSDNTVAVDLISVLQFDGLNAGLGITNGDIENISTSIVRSKQSTSIDLIAQVDQVASVSTQSATNWNPNHWYYIACHVYWETEVADQDTNFFLITNGNNDPLVKFKTTAGTGVIDVLDGSSQAGSVITLDQSLTVVPNTWYTFQIAAKFTGELKVWGNKEVSELTLLLDTTGQNLGINDGIVKGAFAGSNNGMNLADAIFYKDRSSGGTLHSDLPMDFTVIGPLQTDNPYPVGDFGDELATGVWNECMGVPFNDSYYVSYPSSIDGGGDPPGVSMRFGPRKGPKGNAGFDNSIAGAFWRATIARDTGSVTAFHMFAGGNADGNTDSTVEIATAEIIYDNVFEDLFVGRTAIGDAPFSDVPGINEYAQFKFSGEDSGPTGSVLLGDVGVWLVHMDVGSSSSSQSSSSSSISSSSSSSSRSSSSSSSSTSSSSSSKSSSSKSSSSSGDASSSSSQSSSSRSSSSSSKSSSSSSSSQSSSSSSSSRSSSSSSSSSSRSSSSSSSSRSSSSSSQSSSSSSSSRSSSSSSISSSSSSSSSSISSSSSSSSKSSSSSSSSKSSSSSSSSQSSSSKSSSSSGAQSSSSSRSSSSISSSSSSQSSSSSSKSSSSGGASSSSSSQSSSSKSSSSSSSQSSSSSSRSSSSSSSSQSSSSSSSSQSSSSSSSSKSSSSRSSSSSSQSSSSSSSSISSSSSSSSESSSSSQSSSSSSRSSSSSNSSSSSQSSSSSKSSSSSSQSSSSSESSSSSSSSQSSSSSESSSSSQSSSSAKGPGRVEINKLVLGGPALIVVDM